MPLLHIANTHFEQELASEKAISLKAGLRSHPIFMQLQFLPLLYADEGDSVLVTHVPPEEYRRDRKMYTFEEKIPSGYTIDPWGHTLAVQAFARQKNLPYLMPEMGVVKEVHSKAFSCKFAPKEAHACLLQTEEEARIWLKEEPFPKVLKKVYSHAGRGHLVLVSGEELPWERIQAFLAGEWKKGFPVRAERWLKRIFDFSTQWFVHKDQTVSYFGETVFESSSKGAYQRTWVGDETVFFGKHLSFLEEHLVYSQKVLNQIASMQYFGPIGLDAFIYADEKEFLYPITEINARKTMSWAALTWQKKYGQGENCSFSYLPCKPGEPGLLPSFLLDQKNNRIPFTFQLQVFPWEELPSSL